MRIGLYHGYELTGSGSNEYTRYLARYFIEAGHEVHLICREPQPETIPYITQAFAWDRAGGCRLLFERQRVTPACVLHQLPNGDVRPVYLTDKQREGNVKSFVALSDAELEAYHQLNELLLAAILSEHRLDVLHANHLVYQPIAAVEGCRQSGTPLVIFPHGSAIEYTVKQDERYKQRALQGILASAGLIIGNREVRDRILKLYPEHQEVIRAKTRLVGVGVDTTLFSPIPRADRQHWIERLVATDGGGGKAPEQIVTLRQRLQQGDLNATRDYWTAYNHALPDADLNQHLQRIPWDQNILLFVGALTVGKGLQSVIAALPLVLAENPETHLVIVGGGAYREVLEALVFAISSSNQALLMDLCAKGQDLDRNELSGPWHDVQNFLDDPDNLSQILEHGRDLDRHVHFLGRLDHSRLCYLFPCADLAIFPSVIPEAYPLVLMESLANGVLPLVSYFSGFRDGVDDLQPFLDESILEKMKLPVDPERRIKTIAENISGLLAMEELQQIRPQLRKIAVDNYDWALRAAQMIASYRYFMKLQGS